MYVSKRRIGKLFGITSFFMSEENNHDFFCEFIYSRIAGDYIPGKEVIPDISGTVSDGVCF